MQFVLYEIITVQLWYKKNMCQMGFKNAHKWTQAEEPQETITDWLNGLAADFCIWAIIKLVQRLDKLLNCNGDCI
jgi:hypothetical protein